MRREDCFELGHLSRLHGLQGELVAFIDSDQPEQYKTMESVFVDRRGELVPFFIDHIAQNSKGHFIIQFEDVDRTEAEKMVGATLFLPLDLLPPLKGNRFYFHEVIGFTALNQSEEIGEIKQVLDRAAQALLQIEGPHGEEILVPLVDDFIEKVDRTENKFHLNLPDGLLDLYRKDA